MEISNLGKLETVLNVDDLSYSSGSRIILVSEHRDGALLYVTEVTLIFYMETTGFIDTR